MKTVTFIGSVLLCGMIMFGNVANAQSEEIEIKEYCTIDQVQEGDALHGRGIGESRNQQRLVPSPAPLLSKNLARTSR